jgi:hypothetical protein
MESMPQVNRIKAMRGRGDAVLSTACCDIGIDLLTHLFRQLRLTIHVYEDKEFAANLACAFLEDWPCQSSSDELTIRFDPVINAQSRTAGLQEQVIAGYGPNRSDNSRTGKYEFKITLIHR